MNQQSIFNILWHESYDMLIQGTCLFVKYATIHLLNDDEAIKKEWFNILPLLLHIHLHLLRSHLHLHLLHIQLRLQHLQLPLLRLVLQILQVDDGHNDVHSDIHYVDVKDSLPCFLIL